MPKVLKEPKVVKGLKVHKEELHRLVLKDSKDPKEPKDKVEPRSQVVQEHKVLKALKDLRQIED